MEMYGEVKFLNTYGQLNELTRARKAFSPSNTETVLFCE